jgi:regulator of replication initiation timing
LVTPDSPAEVFRVIDALESEVGERLRALSEGVPAARTFARSLLRDHERQRAEREKLRRRLGLPAGVPVRGRAADLGSLSALRTSQEALVHAHVEGLPVLGDPPAVDRLAHHLVALSRHLTVIDLWLEAEENRG